MHRAAFAGSALDIPALIAGLGSIIEACNAVAVQQSRVEVLVKNCDALRTILHNGLWRRNLDSQSARVITDDIDRVKWEIQMVRQYSASKRMYLWDEIAEKLYEHNTLVCNIITKLTEMSNKRPLPTPQVSTDARLKHNEMASKRSPPTPHLFTEARPVVPVRSGHARRSSRQVINEFNHRHTPSTSGSLPVQVRRTHETIKREDDGPPPAYSVAVGLGDQWSYGIRPDGPR
ncbi:hypothetical protein BD410DRAFT_783521 [Rickenella mellea]|uniref:Uncharacterized protein n=1 Tax=Rickenella mellea TaxID=50990 RepID=A0A4Y7QH91_9AGAM|nr:hypothetical protein BD410DRAFT_783521 [Rickenella mellea]